MTASVKVSSTWRTVSGVKVRVSGTWRAVSKGYVRVSGTWRQWLSALISDTFTRANSASLGTTETGETWTTLRGTAWGITSNQATNSDAASNYPIASVALGSQDATTSAVVSPGCGPAVWITDANNWWGSVYYATTGSTSGCGGGATGWSTSDPVTCACGARQTQAINDCLGAASGWSTVDPVTCACGSWQTQVAEDCGGAATAWSTTDPVTCACGSRETQAGTPSCSDYLALFGAGAAAQCSADGGTYSSPNCCFPTTEYRCSATASSHNEYQCSATPRSYTEYRCSDSTTTVTTYQHYVRLLKNVAGVISTVTDTAVAAAVAAISTVTSGTGITATGYSDAGMTASLGTASTTGVTSTRGTGTGILKAPSAYNQGSTVDSFNSGV